MCPVWNKRLSNGRLATKYHKNTFSTFKCILKYHFGATTSLRRWDDLSRLADRVRPRTSTQSQPPKTTRPYCEAQKAYFLVAPCIDNPLAQLVRKMILCKKSLKASSSRVCFILQRYGQHGNMAAVLEANYLWIYFIRFLSCRVGQRSLKCCII